MTEHGTFEKGDIVRYYDYPHMKPDLYKLVEIRSLDKIASDYWADRMYEVKDDYGSIFLASHSKLMAEVVK